MSSDLANNTSIETVKSLDFSSKSLEKREKSEAIYNSHSMMALGGLREYAFLLTAGNNTHKRSFNRNVQLIRAWKLVKELTEKWHFKEDDFDLAFSCWQNMNPIAKKNLIMEIADMGLKLEKEEKDESSTTS